LSPDRRAPLAIEAAATANFVVHASWAVSRSSTPGGEARVETGPELTLVDSGLSTDTFNVVCGARLAPEDVVETVRRVRTHFETVGRPFSWWVALGDEPGDLGRRLEELSLPAREKELAMSARLDSTFSPERWRKFGLRVHRVTTPEDLAHFARINAENSQPPDTAVEAFYRDAASALLGEASPQRFYLARLEEDPVAAVELTLAADVAGVYNLSTRVGRRNRGIGGALLAEALADARAMGHRTAVLQAAPAAAGLYRRLGFREFGVITEHKAPVL
jgi:ribosomal protein S18 acetylase RimI-like enzyme